jgi:hypothetical protein
MSVDLPGRPELDRMSPIKAPATVPASGLPLSGKQQRMVRKSDFHDDHPDMKAVLMPHLTEKP